MIAGRPREDSHSMFRSRRRQSAGVAHHSMLRSRRRQSSGVAHPTTGVVRLTGIRVQDRGLPRVVHGGRPLRAEAPSGRNTEPAPTPRITPRCGGVGYGRTIVSNLSVPPLSCRGPEAPPMPRVQALLECLGLALCEKARKALHGEGRIGDVLPDVARAVLDYAHKELPTDDLRRALGELAALSPEQYAVRIDKLIQGLSPRPRHPVQGGAGRLPAGLAGHRPPGACAGRPTRAAAPPPTACSSTSPTTCSCSCRRGPPGSSPGAEPAGLDSWDLTELRGLGECSEVWGATDEARPDHAAGPEVRHRPDRRRAGRRRRRRCSRRCST